MPTKDAYLFGHLVFSHFGLSSILILRPVFVIKLIIFWNISNISRYFYFTFNDMKVILYQLLSAGKKRLASQFNFTYRYIDDVLSINNPDFENYLGQMYPPELEIKDTTESNTSASYLDLLLSIGRDGQLRIPFTTNVTISISILQTFRS